jgi:ClpP class serine protease
MSFRNTVLTTAGVVVVGATCIGIYKVYSSISEFKKNRDINGQNLIPVITNTRSSLMSSLTRNNDAIDSKSFYDFSQLYDKLDLDKDITVIIHTHGGMMSSGEAIINMILNHNFKSGRTGKIKCFIPYFAYSCGFLIALACDEIVMYKNAIVGPCDAQMSIGSSQHSLDSIIKTMEYKKAHGQKIDEN